MRANVQHTSDQRVPADVDPVSRAELRRLAEVDGPCVSVFLPTSRFGPETLSGPTRLGHLVDRAAEELEAAGAGTSAAREVLSPLRALLQADAFWQHQGDGLALFAAPGFFARYRLTTPLSDDVAVSDAFRLRPLVHDLALDGDFFILAISKNAVRLFHATKRAIRELEPGAIPRSMREAIPQEEPERHGQSHSTGRVEQFHGQGSEADYEKAALERFFRAVDRPIVARLPGQGRPLVLACVGYYVPIYKSVSGYPAIWDEAVEGNPDRRPLADLHDSAWALVAEHFAEPARRQLDRYRQAAGTGLALSVPEEILGAAREGRVDTLLLGDDTPDPADTRVEQALIETLRHDGQVLFVEDTRGLEDGVGALLRY